MWVTLALSYNFLFGIAAQIAFSHFTFYGIGAYAMVILLFQVGLPLPLAVLVGIALCVLLALVVAPTVAASLLVAFVAVQKASLLSAEAASCRDEKAPWILPQVETLVSSLVFSVLIASAGLRSKATRLVTMFSASNPLPTPSELKVAMTHPLSMHKCPDEKFTRTLSTSARSGKT